MSLLRQNHLDSCLSLDHRRIVDKLPPRFRGMIFGLYGIRLSSAQTGEIMQQHSGPLEPVRTVSPWPGPGTRDPATW